MTTDEFEQLLTLDRPPGSLRAELKAMWLDRNGAWEEAHALVQDEDSQEAAWVHAYLHRKEGDLSNAAYWYRRCGRPVCTDRLENEREKITAALLSSE